MKVIWKCVRFVVGEKSVKREEIDRMFDEMIDSIPKIKIETFISFINKNDENV